MGAADTGGNAPDAGSTAPDAGGNDPGECVDDDVDAGGPACGFNGRGTEDRLCVSGAWANQGTCGNDPDECVDDNMDTSGPACGLNDRGTEDRLCVSGAWANQGTCVNDPDECLDDNVDAGGPACGLNGRGTEDRLCVSGAWENQGTCVNDPDECLDDNVDAGGPTCGFNGLGTEDRLCVSGAWENQGTCGNDPCVGQGAPTGVEEAINHHRRVEKLISNFALQYRTRTVAAPGAPYDVLQLEAWGIWPNFPSYRPMGPRTVTFSGENYASCETCAIVFQGCIDSDGDGEAESCARSFLAESGTLEFTADGGVGRRLTATLTDATFVEVSIASDGTFTSTPVNSGDAWCIASHAINVEQTDQPLPRNCPLVRNELGDTVPDRIWSSGPERYFHIPKETAYGPFPEHGEEYHFDNYACYNPVIIGHRLRWYDGDPAVSEAERTVTMWPLYTDNFPDLLSFNVAGPWAAEEKLTVVFPSAVGVVHEVVQPGYGDIDSNLVFGYETSARIGLIDDGELNFMGVPQPLPVVPYTVWADGSQPDLNEEFVLEYASASRPLIGTVFECCLSPSTSHTLADIKGP